jgi:hypothetical protein
VHHDIAAGLRHVSFALSGLAPGFHPTQGLRPGLQSVAASRLSHGVPAAMSKERT